MARSPGNQYCRSGAGEGVDATAQPDQPAARRQLQGLTPVHRTERAVGFDCMLPGVREEVPAHFAVLHPAAERNLGRWTVRNFTDL